VSILSVVLCAALLLVTATWVCIRTPTLRHRAALIYPLALLSAGVVALPVCVAITWLLEPFWSWVGPMVGMRLITRGGPAFGCYVVTLVACVGVLGSGSILLVRRRVQQKREPEKGHEAA
jgi:hypothetical protein